MTCLTPFDVSLYSFFFVFFGGGGGIDGKRGDASFFPEGSMVAIVFLRSFSTCFSSTFCRIRLALWCRLATTWRLKGQSHGIGGLVPCTGQSHESSAQVPLSHHLTIKGTQSHGIGGLVPPPPLTGQSHEISAQVPFSHHLTIKGTVSRDWWPCAD
jgi:hypothetical protein